MNAKDSRRVLPPALAMLALCAGAAAVSAPKAPPTRTQPMSYGAGTLSLANGNYQFAPQGCTHNGNRAVCNFYVTYSGAAAGNVNAWANYWNQWTMNVQLIDNLHVPHGPDTAYFIDGSGAHQPVLFLQQGTQVWVAVEFPNVDSSVSTGEFHMNNQVVGGVQISQPNAQGTAAGNTQLANNSPQAQAVSQAPAAAAPTTNCVAGTPGYSGATLCNLQDKIAVANSWKSMLSSFVPAKANTAPQTQMQAPQTQMQPPQMQPPQMQPPQPQMQPPQMQPPQMQPPQPPTHQ